MTVAEFHMDSAQAVPPGGLKLDRGSVLNSRPVNGVPCKFRTCYDLTFWPVAVTEAEWKTPDRLQPPLKSSEAVAAVRIGLRCPGDLRLDKLTLSSLRFYLNGESNLVHTLYELLCNNISHIVIRDTSPKSRAQPVILGPDALRPAGFGEHDGMLPYARRSFIGYRLLQEYFCFPQKFFFLDLTGLERICEAGFGGQAEILLMISPFERSERRQLLELGVGAKTFRLNCAPIVNLFAKTAEPILLDHTAYEYQVVPDVNRRRAMEIFEITEVKSANPQSGEVVQFEPCYSYRHGVHRSKTEAFGRASGRVARARASKVRRCRP
jgi:type VI secretion system protein ImpG